MANVGAGSQQQVSDQAPGTRELLHRSLFEHALLEVHIWELVRDAAGNIVTWRLVDANAAALKSWGRELDDVVGLTTGEIFPNTDPVKAFLPIVSEIMATGQPKEWQLDFAGTDQVLHMISIPVGEYFVSTGFDVTADRRRERELRDALLSLTRATQAGGVGLWDWDLVTNTVRYSDEWKRQLGYEPHEIADSFEEWRVRVHPDDLDAAMATVRSRIERADQGSDMVFRMRHRDGSYRWILAQSSLILDDDGRPQRMLGSHVDITERRRLEERAMEAQKLESLGTLAAGIAHDFNNLLSAITGNVSLLRANPPADADTAELLKELDEASRRATALTHQLLTFAKGGSPILNVTSVRELVIDSATFVTRGSHARCVFHVADDLSTVKADVGQLSQVINNLVINAMQAMPDGGDITITAGNLALTEPNPCGLPAGSYVRISVADEGAGIAPEVLPRIFDPFFTTKATGSGLGLSSSYSIVTRHGGSIAVRSTLGKGTVFDVCLPASGDTAPRRTESPIVTGAGRILVMDDEVAIQRLSQRMLARLGYECDTCGDGDEAVRLFGDAYRAGRPYDAVILDLTIPGRRGGAQVLPLLQAIDANTKAIVASGYAEDDILSSFEQHGFRGRLRKPVSLASLSGEVARVLTGP
jgi:PAS domain S-box-containing protein